MINNKILITGTSSGLGSYLKKKFNCIGFNRKKNFKVYKKKWDLIIHCGFHSGNNENKILEAIKISNNISSLKSKKKIFISSLIVYSKIETLYKSGKIISESFFINKKNSYIIRLGSIVGPGMRKNTIKKIIYDRNPKVGLSGNSKFSFIHYEEIFHLIKDLVIQKDIKEVDFIRRDFITLKKISKMLKKNTKFGHHLFNCIDTKNKEKLKFKYILNNKNSIDIIKALKK